MQKIILFKIFLGFFAILGILSCQKTDSAIIKKFSDRSSDDQVLFENPVSGIQISFDSLPLSYHVVEEHFTNKKTEIRLEFKKIGKDKKEQDLRETLKITHLIGTKAAIDSVINGLNVHKPARNIEPDFIDIVSDYPNYITLGNDSTSLLYLVIEHPIEKRVLLEKLSGSLFLLLDQIKRTYPPRNRLEFNNKFIGRKIVLNAVYPEYRIYNNRIINSILFRDTTFKDVAINYSTLDLKSPEGPAYLPSKKEFDKRITTDVSYVHNNKNRSYHPVKINGKNHLFYQAVLYSDGDEKFINAATSCIDTTISLSVSFYHDFPAKLVNFGLIKIEDTALFFTEIKKFQENILSNFHIDHLYNP